jgi:hypothetical protein
MGPPCGNEALCVFCEAIKDQKGFATVLGESPGWSSQLLQIRGNIMWTAQAEEAELFTPQLQYRMVWDMGNHRNGSWIRDFTDDRQFGGLNMEHAGDIVEAMLSLAKINERIPELGQQLGDIQTYHFKLQNWFATWQPKPAQSIALKMPVTATSV